VRRSVSAVVWPLWCLLGGAACGGGTNPPAPTPPCNTAAGQAVTLNPADYQSIPPLATAGCLLFPGNASASASVQYLVVPQIATDSEGAQTPFILDGDTLHPILAARAARAGRNPGWDVRFHDFLRHLEQTRYADFPPRAGGARVTAAVPQAPPVVGDKRAFSVCAALDCSKFKVVNATAQLVNGHLAIFVDDSAPANGLTAADLDSLGVQFESRLYPIDTTAFGRESDIDGNSVVIVLMTNVVNQLVSSSQCAANGGAFVAGFFFGADIDPLFANDARVNHGEVFYSIVADSLGVLSCPHSASRLRRQVPVTFIHEFQHMISYNQHVLLRGGSPQVTWLDEGMSHFAEELGGRSYLQVNDTLFSVFVINDLFNAYSYLDAPDQHFLAFGSGIGTLAERGAAWLFTRFLVDQYAADTDFASVAAFTRSLEQTPLAGGPAIASVTGVPFATIDEHWVLANYVSDLPGFTAPPELRYKSWQFHAEFASLNAQCANFSPPCPFPKPFPLTPPVTAGNDASLSGTLHAGSGSYAVIQQAPQDPGFGLLFSAPGGKALPAALNPRFTVIRIQ
jgi:hypothetical protein